MIIRLLGLILLPLLAYWFVRWLSARLTLSRVQTRWLMVGVIATLVLTVLVIMGRLPVHFIFAPIGVALAFLLKMLPMLFRLLPLWALLRDWLGSGRRRRGAGGSTGADGSDGFAGADGSSRAGGSGRSDAMTRRMALEILGLKEGADRAAVIKAHRDLMRRLHPDRGGSDYLAKRINQAKDFLLQGNIG